jgi:cellobiose epimerase
MPDETRMRATMLRAEAELRDDILPFWIQHTVDKERGGFYGMITNDLALHADAPRGALLSARILWTYAAAYRRYRDAAYLDMARWAYEDLINRFWDTVYGGFYWMVTSDGEVASSRKHIYVQAFGIYALAEYYAATGTEAALETAQHVFQLMETHSHDAEHLGYFEAFGRDWEQGTELRLGAGDQDALKSMNTHLHVMEAFTNLLRVWPDPLLKARQAELIQIMMTRITDPATARMTLFFNAAWEPTSEHISYGHDIEASWLLVESTGVLGDAELDAAARALSVRMAQAVYEGGLDPDGALVYESGPEGLVDDTKQWWPQAEASVGFLNAYQISGEQHFLDAALRAWDFIEAYLIDREHGEWLRYVTRDRRRPDETGKENESKVSFWKCPYHNGRACLELTERLQHILATLQGDDRSP